MAKNTRKADLKSWKRKFLGITATGDGETREDVLSNAQKLINIFRQIHVLDETSKAKFEQMVLDISPEKEEVLWDLAGGKDVLGFKAYLQEQNGTLVEEDETALDDAELEAEKARARIIAEALSASQAQNSANMQEQQMAHMERLAQALENSQRNSGGGEGGNGGGSSHAFAIRFRFPYRFCDSRQRAKPGCQQHRR